MRAIFSLVEPDSSTRRAYCQVLRLTKVINPAWMDEIEDRATAALEPGSQAPSRLSHYLELHWPASLQLDDSGAVANLPTAHDISDLDLDEITATQLAVDCQIKQRSVPQSSLLVEIVSNGPDVARL
jgi:hypothetical protein